MLDFFMNVSTESGEKKRAVPVRREDMVRPGKVIADGYRREVSEKDRAGIFYIFQHCVIVLRNNFQMLRRKLIDNLHPLL